MTRLALILAVCVSVLGPAGWRPSPAAEAPSSTSILLVARSGLPDPTFENSIILVMNNLAAGPVGVIVNRPTKISVSSLFPQFKSLVGVPDKVYFGGPVDTDSVWFLIRAGKQPEHSLEACAGVFLSGDQQLLFKLLKRGNPMAGLRIIVGHAGWAPGQLEAEIARRDWTSKRADGNTIFNDKDEHPWPSPHPVDEPLVDI